MAIIRSSHKKAGEKFEKGDVTVVAQVSKPAVSQISNLRPVKTVAAIDLKRARRMEFGDTAGLETCATFNARNLFF